MVDAVQRQWPSAGTTEIPYWVYTDPDVYAREQERIFGGASWSYVGLTCEIPAPGDFKRSNVGEVSVVLVRDEDGELRCFENRCAHRGVQFCREERGNSSSFQCPYHQWTYDLQGRLAGVPFQGGVRGQGGMPEDFSREAHGLRTLRVMEHNGVIFASFDPTVPPFVDYLGPSMLHYFERVFDGRELRLLGYLRQRTPANWKLMFENIKDPYHASLLHVFLVSFGLFRADNPSAVKMDASGGHACLISQRGEQRSSEATAEMGSFNSRLTLDDPRLLELRPEFPGEETVVIQTIWPSLVVQQQSNTLATRQIVPRGPDAFDLHWTFFGYADDDEEMTQHRLRQANLMGPSGFVSIDDGEVLAMTQAGVGGAGDSSGLLEMGGHEHTDTDHMVTEAAVRAFYEHYRRVMGF